MRAASRLLSISSASGGRLPLTFLRRGFSTTTPSKLDGRTAIVTGSARGIGRAIAVRLAHDGYDVCVNDIRTYRKEAEEVAAEIKAAGRKSCVAIADVAVLSQVEQMVQTSVKELGPLNTMVANAGIAHVKRLLDVSPTDFERLFRINVFGVHHCFATAARQLIAQKTCTADAPGKLICAASIVAFKPFALLSPYSATKFAVRGLTQGYAMEMAPHHITANAYAPGIVGTNMWDLIDAELGKEEGRARGETIAKYTRELIALGRTSVPEDVAKLVSFLASRDSDYVTGQTQIVDGGIVFA